MPEYGRLFTKFAFAAIKGALAKQTAKTSRF